MSHSIHVLRVADCTLQWYACLTCIIVHICIVHEIDDAGYTFSALICLPLAIATHPPVVVEIPLPIAIPCIIGDHAKLVI
jgi:hypothetical protein